MRMWRSLGLVRFRFQALVLPKQSRLLGTLSRSCPLDWVANHRLWTLQLQWATREAS